MNSSGKDLVVGYESLVLQFDISHFWWILLGLAKFNSRFLIYLN